MSEASGAQATAPKGRNTRQKRIVEQMLTGREDFVSAQELHQLIVDAGESVSLATVYRILQAQQQDGLVDVLRTADGEALYRKCADPGHHHHLVCRRCGAAEEVQAPTVEKWADRIAAEYGYTEIEHTIEVFGLCPRCSAAD
ncbi:Fur family transcriptional regulator [Micrococcoides hystricis]|uniref:Fur family transcriptional regulator n=1 Tax=Micrococcoides hystricis TaxID=1572761 RepID=A0ABV6PBS0_9MICC